MFRHRPRSPPRRTTPMRPRPRHRHQCRCADGRQLCALLQGRRLYPDRPPAAPRCALTGAGTCGESAALDAGGWTVHRARPGAGRGRFNFSIQPTAQAAGGLRVRADEPVAARRRRRRQDHRGRHQHRHRGPSRRYGANAANPNAARDGDHPFTSPTTYTINGGAPAAYTPGAAIAANGWQVQFSGTPAGGRYLHGAGNAGGTGDNRNALAAAAQQSQGISRTAPSASTARSAG